MGEAGSKSALKISIVRVFFLQIIFVSFVDPKFPKKVVRGDAPNCGLTIYWREKNNSKTVQAHGAVIRVTYSCYSDTS